MMIMIMIVLMMVTLQVLLLLLLVARRVGSQHGLDRKSKAYANQFANVLISRRVKRDQQ
jgi:hypothetical protein